MVYVDLNRHFVRMCLDSSFPMQMIGVLGHIRFAAAVWNKTLFEIDL